MTATVAPAAVENAEKNVEQNSVPKTDSGEDILNRINKTVDNYSLDNLKKNLSMTQISEMVPTMFTIMKGMLDKLNTQTEMLTSLLNNKTVENSNLKNEYIT